jgi:hypothetical protein
VLDGAARTLEDDRDALMPLLAPCGQAFEPVDNLERAVVSGDDTDG